ncbi:response regulator transcription factor [Spirosoma sp. BT704]|uniref:Response regulator transcription factor n=2 Tax=Spirosoma validum TaxID=2771355 RepID=A0A927B5K0_9BACT|nr:response regulator transcription factor [Spirosoma validum]
MKPDFRNTLSRPTLPTSTLRIYMREIGKFDFPVSDLMYLQASGNYSWLYWKDGQRMLMPRTLKYYMDRLPHEWFIRLHRNCVVNLHYIERMERISQETGGLMYLHSGLVLPVSRRRWFAIRRLLPHLN